jgi:hypothetical protein
MQGATQRKFDQGWDAGNIKKVYTIIVFTMKKENQLIYDNIETFEHLNLWNIKSGPGCPGTA